ncbi:hypothetical protein MAPG_02617 [Magnaporthiopsis poae ATCC 64411]|uniref:Uncharacterized protein n=1 Tax=Magnaporthiopsis poae (strain ATCC 64411 / 73-15) TaxID=644358 RepID=A0A0C4CSC1_MAGP6|nr:hypothetical protein, variant [Magnaporthiopsis poae ATCC 64411]KLU83563.1 hypothetical protein MAPG_02617 [Magnaporthiopsis poae ATCC 64411]
MFGDNIMASKRDLLRQSSSAEPRSGFWTTIILSSAPDLRRRQNDGNRDRGRSGNNNNNNNGNGGGSNTGGGNGSGGGDSENRNGRGFRGEGGDPNGSGRGGGRGTGLDGDRGGRGDGSSGGDRGNNRGGGGSGRGGNNRNDGGGDRGSKNKGDSGGGRNNDDRNSNNGNRFRNGGNRNGDGRDKDATSAQPASSAASTSSPATSSAPTPPAAEASGQVPVSPVSSIPPEVNGAISSSSTPPAAESTTMGPAAATPSPPATAGGVALGPGISSETATTVSISSRTQGDTTSSSTPTLNAGIGLGDSAVRDSQWQEADNSMAMGQRKVMSGTTERVLIAVGSIGAFIFVSFLAWAIWRTARRFKRRKENQTQSDYQSYSSQERPGFSHRLAARLPFLRNRQEEHWLNADDKGYGDQKNQPLTFGPSEVPVAPIKGFYGSEKVDSLQAPPPILAPLQIQPLTQPPLPQLQLQTEQLGGVASWFPMSPAARQQEQAGGPVWPMGSAQSQEMQFQAVFAAASNAYSPGALSPGASINRNIFTHQTTGSFSSTNAAQFGATTPSSDVGGTWRPGMGPANGYHNQSRLARQPSDAYDPARRQVGRESVLSSLSSGFGDGDIVVPQQVRQPARDARATGVNESEAQQHHTGARASWTSRTDTVYTESSDDSPPRYRNITSWVRQQSSRARRAEQRGARPVAGGASDGGVEGTGVRAMPPEPRLDMMMDDGQAPRSPVTMAEPAVSVTKPQQG